MLFNKRLLPIGQGLSLNKHLLSSDSLKFLHTNSTRRAFVPSNEEKSTKTPYLYRIGKGKSKDSSSSAKYDQHSNRKNNVARNLLIAAGIGIVGTVFTYKYYLNNVDKMSPEYFKQLISGKESSAHSDSLNKKNTEEVQSAGNANLSKLKTKTLRSHHIISRTRIYDIEVCRGDILEEKTDAIVIPMSSNLALEQNELAKSVAQKAGEQFTKHLQNYLSKHGQLKTNAVTLSNASGDLNCKFIVCAASPTWNGGYGSEETDLFHTIYNALEAVDRELLESIAIPAVGINQFHFPKEKSANIIFDAITTYFNDKHTVAKASSKKVPLRNIRIVIADPQTLDVFIDEFDKRKRYGKYL